MHLLRIPRDTAEGLNAVIYSGKFPSHNCNAKVEKADYPGCFLLPEGPAEQESTDENKRL